jgi:hypothetical protein
LWLNWLILLLWSIFSKCLNEFVKVQVSISIYISLTDDLIYFIKSQIDILALQKCLELTWRYKSISVGINLLESIPQFIYYIRRKFLSDRSLILPISKLLLSSGELIYNCGLSFSSRYNLLVAVKLSIVSFLFGMIDRSLS